MAIVFEANYSKKLGLPGFSSHQYNVTVRVELADINQVQQESERLYGLLQSCVDKEIQQTGFLPVTQSNGSGYQQNGSNGHYQNGHNGNNGSNGHSNGNGDSWKCTPKQRELILRIVEENNLDKNDIESLAKERFNSSVRSLNTMQASGLIEELLEKYPGNKPANGNNGNGSTGNRRYAGRGAL